MPRESNAAAVFADLNSGHNASCLLNKQCTGGGGPGTMGAPCIGSVPVIAVEDGGGVGGSGGGSSLTKALDAVSLSFFRFMSRFTEPSSGIMV